MCGGPGLNEAAGLSGWRGVPQCYLDLGSSLAFAVCVSFSKQPDISVPLWEEESETSPKCDDRNRSSGNREVPSAS